MQAYHLEKMGHVDGIVLREQEEPKPTDILAVEWRKLLWIDEVF